MLTGAGLARMWHHARAHRFFSAARWCPTQVGLVLAELIVGHLLPVGAPITLAVDDTLFRRRGRKVHGTGWFHDGSAAGQAKLGFGNNWVVVAIVVALPFVSRPVALPVLGVLAVKGGRTKPDLARDLVDAIAEHFGDRDIHLVADAADGCGAFIGLGEGMSMTTRAKANAVFSQLAPPRTGKRGRPRRKGDRIGTPADIAATARWTTATVSRYGTTSTVQITEQICLWYGTWRTLRSVKRLPRLLKRGHASNQDRPVVFDLGKRPSRLRAREATRMLVFIHEEERGVWRGCTRPALRCTCGSHRGLPSH